MDRLLALDHADPTVGFVQPVHGSAEDQHAFEIGHGFRGDDLAGHEHGNAGRVDGDDLGRDRADRGIQRNVILVREERFADQDYIPLDSAIGAVSSEIVTVYPPGIPVLVPGEIITAEAVTYPKRMLELGGTVDGLDETNSWIGVVKR